MCSGARRELGPNSTEGFADRVYDSIERTCGLLNDHPRLGRARPEIQPEARSIVIERWLALYHIYRRRRAGCAHH